MTVYLFDPFSGPLFGWKDTLKLPNLKIYYIPIAKSTKIDDHLFGNVSSNIHLSPDTCNTRICRIWSDWDTTLTT